jgi:hypothetical protein
MVFVKYALVLHNASKAAQTVAQVKSKLDRKEDMEILDWLTPFDYGLFNTRTISKGGSQAQGNGWLIPQSTRACQGTASSYFSVQVFQE